MKRSRTHQIDELAQRFLRNALPSTWVPNEQSNDYAKDYLVEIGEDNGELTGSSFYIQLKGQEHADFSDDGMLVKFYLRSKYARYYLDKIRDLPVFLVLVDVNEKKGWWMFLQPVLEADQTWRKQDSITLRLPTANDIIDTTQLQTAVDEAKKWMRLHHPVSIDEAVVAHKQRITSTDPRFDVRVSLVNDKPNFTLLAKEKVPLTFTFTGDREEIGTKVSDLIDKGALVAFQPGEVKVSGSRLFEQVERSGCSIQATVTLPGSLTLICMDAEGKELSRLSEVPGRFSGGRKELWFDGGLVNSPLAVKVGPIAPGMGGSLHLDLNLHRWDGQPLTHLAYFDRLNTFLQALPESLLTTIECQQDGNRFFSARLPLHDLPFALPLARYLTTLSHARMVAHRFSVNPAWAVEKFDQDTQETADELHAVFFGSGWKRAMPNVRLKASCIRNSFRFDVAKRAEKPGFMRLVSDCSYVFLGQHIELGKLVHDYTEMTAKVVRKNAQSTTRKQKKGKGKKVRATKPSRRDTVEIALVGSEATIMHVRREEPTSVDSQAGLSLLSERTKVDFPSIP